VRRKPPDLEISSAAGVFETHFALVPSFCERSADRTDAPAPFEFLPKGLCHALAPAGEI
jgi:hypothetical protein